MTCVFRWDSEEMFDKDRGPRTSSDAIRTILFTILPLILLPACQGPEPSTEAFQVADSAGVAIVESARPLWDSGEGWTLSPEPEVVIGLVEGDEKYLLSQVVGVRRLSDGRIAVLDAGAYRVRVYDSTGRHLMDLGGEGDGPSEFRYPQFLGVVSDTLFVYESTGDLTWFSPDGQFLRASSDIRHNGGERSRPVIIGILEDRFAVGFRMVGMRDRQLVEGLNREPIQIWRFDLFDSGADSLFSVPGHEEMIFFPGSGATGHRPYVFGKMTLLAASKDWIYVAPTDEFSVQVFDREGILRRIFRRGDPPRRVTPSDFDRWMEQAIEGRARSPEEEAEMRRTAGELSIAETMPSFRWIAVDSEGNLWVEEFEGIGRDQGRFSVFGSDGAWLGHVDIPEGLPWRRGDNLQQLIEIGTDYLLGVWADDFGVQQVRVYPIEKR